MTTTATNTETTCVQHGKMTNSSACSRHRNRSSIVSLHTMAKYRLHVVLALLACCVSIPRQAAATTTATGEWCDCGLARVHLMHLMLMTRPPPRLRAVPDASTSECNCSCRTLFAPLLIYFCFTVLIGITMFSIKVCVCACVVQGHNHSCRAQAVHPPMHALTWASDTHTPQFYSQWREQKLIKQFGAHRPSTRKASVAAAMHYEVCATITSTRLTHCDQMCVWYAQLESPTTTLLCRYRLAMVRNC